MQAVHFGTVFVAMVALSTFPEGKSSGASADGSAGDEARFLSRTRQLTFAGRRAGEGYYSPDGTILVFQSERDPENPFYQIFELDLTTGDTRRVSPGYGKTTCAFIRPGTGDVLFSSTHHDPRSLELQREELDFRASGEERRYAWDYDPEMEIYVEERSDGDTSGDLRRLTHARGYDAEASYSPDGEWIVFSSNRAAYAASEGGEESADTERQDLLEVDPSYYLDLYRMRADGSELQRLTDAPGYDGGPFFSADGEWIVWRRFDEKGLTAEIFTARPDGSEARPLTSMGSMSWAPYFHPSREYVIFTSNQLGFGNFELFLVDFEGSREPVRVTFTDGFDGLPVFTPDGSGLTWTTNRRGSSQLFTARWNHEAALTALEASPMRGETP